MSLREHSVSDQRPASQTTVLIRADGSPVLVLVDEHDLSTAPQIEEDLQVLITDNEIVVVDLSNTTFLDSSALGAVLRASQQARSLGHQVVVETGENESVERLLELMGLDRHLHRERSL